MGDLVSVTRTARWVARPLALVGLLTLSAVMAAGAQEVGKLHSIAVRDVSVGEALDRVVALTGISLVFSSDVSRGRSTVCRVERVPAEDLLRCVVEGAGLDFYRLSSGTYVVIERAEQAPAYGTLSGQVLDGVTGAPVPYVTVETEDGGARAYTNAAGLFVLSRVLPGPQGLRAHRLGYSSFRTRVEVPASGAARRSIVMVPEALELDPIVVDGLERHADERSLGDARWTADEPQASVGALGDLSLQARSALGLSRSPLFADVSIQGSGPGEHVVRLDGVPIFDPVSIGRTRSAFSPLALRRVTVSKGGFGVGLGSFTSGVIDLEHAVSDASGVKGFSILTDPYDANVEASIPLSIGGGEGSMLVAGRSSIWSLYREPALDDALRRWNDIDPVLMRAVVGDDIFHTDGLRFDAHRHGSDLAFGDLHAAIRLSFDGFRTLNASFYRGTNEVGTELFASGSSGEARLDRLMLTRDRYDWTNTAAQVRLDWLVGDRGAARVQVRHSRHGFTHAYDMVDGHELGYQPGVSSPAELELLLARELDARPPSNDGNDVEEWAVEVGGDFSPGAGHTLSAGVEGAWLDSRAELLNSYTRAIRVDDRGWRWSGYARDRWSVGRRLALEGGVRATALDGTGFLEPRFAVRWDDASPALGPWSARVAWGVYRQYVTQMELTNLAPSALVPDVRFWLPADASSAPPRARHLTFELLAEPWQGWKVRAESYYKWLDRILALDYSALTAPAPPGAPPLGRAEVVAAAEGRAFGAGVRVEHEGPRVRARLGYDWSVSERTFPSRFDGEMEPTPWNEPHAMSAAAELALPLGVAATASGRSVWGRTWALRRAYYDALAPGSPSQVADGPPIGLPGDDVVPASHELDVGLRWTGLLSGFRAVLHADVRNVLDRQNVLDYSLWRTSAPGGTEYSRLPRTLPGRSLVLSVRLGG